jgi:hypothetical protein
MRFGRLAVVLLLAMLLTSTAAWAQVASQEVPDEPSFCVTAYYNLNRGGGLYQDLSASTLDKSASHGIGFSLMAGASNLLSAEMDFNYAFSFFGSSNSDVLGGNHVGTITLDGIFGPSIKAGSGRIRPYLSAGGGYMRGSVGKRHYFGWSDNSKDLALLEAGGGVSWRFNTLVGVRADVRYRRGFGAKEDDDTWGNFFDNWSYIKSTLGVPLSF